MNGDKWYYVNPPSKTIVKSMSRERVKLGTLILIGANRLLELACLAFILTCFYLLVTRFDLVVYFLTFGGVYK